MEQNSSCYSPLHRLSRFPVRNQSLLLQFMLMAFVQEKTETKSSHAAMHEHLQLFPVAFPEMDGEIAVFSRFLKRASAKAPLSARLRREGFRKLKPFFHVCKNDEGLWLFLMKHGHHLDFPRNIIALLQEIYAEDLSVVSQRMSGAFSARGFTGPAKNCISLFESYV